MDNKTALDQTIRNMSGLRDRGHLSPSEKREKVSLRMKPVFETKYQAYFK